MSECQVQRTLVKSPPELWEALSDPAALARHLGEFGEIRITRLEPETTVEWEGEHASGTVHLKPSGWGTKVTLTATPAGADEPEPTDASGATTALVVWTAPQPFPAPPPETAEPEAAVEDEADPEPVTADAAEEIAPAGPPDVGPEPAAPVLPVRQGWFQRLFGRRAAVAELPPQPPAPAPVPIEPPMPEPEPMPEPDVEPPPAAHTPLATLEPDVPTVEFAVTSLWEPEATPKIDGERATALLTSVLDDLGAAHHRPFSR